MHGLLLILICKSQILIISIKNLTKKTIKKTQQLQYHDTI